MRQTYICTVFLFLLVLHPAFATEIEGGGTILDTGSLYLAESDISGEGISGSIIIQGGGVVAGHTGDYIPTTSSCNPAQGLFEISGECKPCPGQFVIKNLTNHITNKSTLQYECNSIPDEIPEEQKMDSFLVFLFLVIAMISLIKEMYDSQKKSDDKN